MISVSTFADLQGALAAGEPSIEICGQVDGGTSYLTVSHPDGILNFEGITRISGGRLLCAGIVVNAARRVKFEGIEVWSTGHALQVNGATHVFVEDSYLRSPTVCLAADGIAGMWVRGTHMNGEGTSAIGMRVGESSTGYEALDVDSCLFESCFTDVRVGGGPANCVNLRFSRNWHDRPTSAAYLIAPAVTANCRNINIADDWINGADYPIAIDMSQTTGRVDRLNLGGTFELLGCAHGLTSTFGDSSRTSVNQNAHIITGPLEPG